MAKQHIISRRMVLGGAASLLALIAADHSVALALARPRRQRAPHDARIERLIAQMTLEQKAGQLTLYADSNNFTIEEGAIPVNPTANNQARRDIIDKIGKGHLTGLFSGQGFNDAMALQRMAVEQAPLGIPLIFAGDVIHGFRTIFPVPIGEAASFDPELCARTARAAAVEATTHGIQWTFAPMVDVARDQRWGRVAEGAGEDPYLGSVIAAARVRGFQGPDLTADTSMLACPKHFAAYGGVQGGMDYNTVDIPETTLRETFLPPFRAAFNAGALTTMSAFNDIGGVPATANHHLLTGILRDEWGFSGLVVSDYTADWELVPHGFAADSRDAAKKSLMAGCDISMQSGLYLDHIPDLVRNGEVPMRVVDEAVRRVLRVKAAIGLFDNPYRSLDFAGTRARVGNADLHALAREAGRQSIVMLKNDDALLPLRKSGQKIALIGPFGADTRDLMGAWSIYPDFDQAVPVDVGLRSSIANPADLVVVKGCEVTAPIDGGIAAAVAAAHAADVVLLAIGESADMAGEAQSRVDIVVPPAQQALAEAVAATGKPIVILLRHGRALALHGAVKNAQAILATWFLGSQTGHAIADIIFGDHSPSGRLPVSFPQESGQQPYFYNHRNTGRAQTNPDEPSFRSRYREVSFAPLYPFGHGLTYGSVEYSATTVSSELLTQSGSVTVTCTLRNSGAQSVREVAQLYIHDKVASLTQPVRQLKGFEAITLAPGESRDVHFTLTADDLAFVNAQLQHVAEPGLFDIWIAPNAHGGTGATLRLG